MVIVGAGRRGSISVSRREIVERGFRLCGLPRRASPCARMIVCHLVQLGDERPGECTTSGAITRWLSMSRPDVISG